MNVAWRRSAAAAPPGRCVDSVCRGPPPRLVYRFFELTAVAGPPPALPPTQAAYDPTKTETKYEIQCLSDGGTINEDGDCVPAAGKTAVPNQEMKDYFFEAYDNQHNCVVSLKHPDKASAPTCSARRLRAQGSPGGRRAGCLLGERAPARPGHPRRRAT